MEINIDNTKSYVELGSLPAGTVFVIPGVHGSYGIKLGDKLKLGEGFPTTILAINLETGLAMTGEYSNPNTEVTPIYDAVLVKKSRT